MSIGAQYIGDLALANHDFRVLRRPNGEIISQLHGLAYDPVTYKVKAIGTLNDQLKFFENPEGHSYGGTEYDNGSTIVYTGTEQDVLSRWILRMQSKGGRGFDMLTRWVGVWKPLMVLQSLHERFPHASTVFFG